MLDFLKSSAASYIGMLIAVVAIVLGVVMPDYSAVAWTVAGVLGYGSVAALRTQIDSAGYKTYIVFGITIVLMGLQMFNVLPAETVQALFVAFAPVTGITVQQALAKSSATVKKLK
jgi:hypothetical protein